MADTRRLHALPTPTATPDPVSAPWAELHVHSSLSFLQGASDPADLVAEAARLGTEVLAVTDRDGLYAAQRLTEAAGEAGIATVIGAELALDGTGLGPVVVLARDLTGYQRLSAAISAAQLAGSKGSPRYDLAALGRAAGGHWAVLTGCPDPAAPDHRDVVAAATRLRALSEVFGAGNTFAELVDHHLPEDSLRNDALFVAARSTGCAVVASNAVHYATPARARTAQALTALRRRQTVERAAGYLMPAPTAHLRSGTEMRQVLARYPGVLEATVELGRSSVVDLTRLRPRLPEFTVPDGHSDDSWLRHLAEEATTARFGPRTAPAGQPAWRQLDHELAVIAEMGLAGYFLIVHDVVAFARTRDIWCQGRGSAASSVTCYVLGITNVDPIRHELLFERFLSTEKSGPPDIDIDFEHQRREEVIQYLYTRYGRTHAAQVANVIAYRPRLAVRDAARVLGYPSSRIDDMTRHIHHEPPPADADIPGEVRELAAELDGLPRHLGVHSGGMVLTRQPIGEIMPVEWATAADRSVLQGDKDDVAAAGLVKIDLLGLGILTALHDACHLIATHHGPHYDLASIPPDDPAVYEMITRGDCLGCFQIESRAQISMLPRLKPKRFDDLVVAVSLIRPGPIQGGSVHPYLRRRAGREAITYPHPLAEPALKRSLGVALWQESAMRLAIDCAGFTAGEADKLRKAMAAKHAPQRVAQLRQRLLDGMAARGIGPAAAQRIVTMIEAFSDYGFPLSHAQSMAHLVYASAWLKKYYPAAFTAALLNAQPMGFYSPATLIGDARRHGVPVRRVDVNASGVRATLEPGDPGPAGGQPAIRLGLNTVKRLGAHAARAIADGRPYRDLDDLARRTRLRAGDLERLAAAGAFGSLGVDRRTALWAAGPLSHTSEDTLPGTTEVNAPALPPMTPAELTFADLWATGSSPDSHPVQHLRPHLRRLGARTAAEIRRAPDRSPVLIGALVTHRQRPPTAKGVCFLTIEDETGVVNAIVPAATWTRYRTVALDHAALLLHGTAERADGAVNILVTHLEPLRLTTTLREAGPG